MIKYCPESHRMWDGEVDLTKEGPYYYNFTASGFFTLLDNQGEPLYNKALPHFTKASSHLIWFLLWTIGFFGLFFFIKTPVWVFVGLGALLVFHALLFTFHFIKLLLMRGVKALLRPPRWIKLTRKLQQGEGMALLQKEELSEHPGMLANLALVEAVRGQAEASKEAILTALKLCPDHVALKSLYHHLASKSFVLDVDNQK